MAKTRGRDGLLHVGGAVIGNIRDFTLNQEAINEDSTTATDDAETHSNIRYRWDGEAIALVDSTDASQDALTVGASVALVFFPEGNTSGKDKYSGNATVLGVTMGNKHEGMAEVTFSFQGDGALTKAAVV